MPDWLKPIGRAAPDRLLQKFHQPAEGRRLGPWLDSFN